MALNIHPNRGTMSRMRRWLLWLLLPFAIACKTSPDAAPGKHVMASLGTTDGQVSIADGTAAAVNQTDGNVQGVTPGDEVTFALQSSTGVVYPNHWVLRFMSKNAPTLNGRMFTWDPTSGASASFSVLTPPSAFSATYTSTVYDPQSNILSQYSGTLTNALPSWNLITDGGAFSVVSGVPKTRILVGTLGINTETVNLPGCGTANDGQTVVISLTGLTVDGGVKINVGLDASMTDPAVAGGVTVDAGKVSTAGKLLEFTCSGSKGNWYQGQ